MALSAAGMLSLANVAVVSISLQARGRFLPVAGCFRQQPLCWCPASTFNSGWDDVHQARTPVSSSIEVGLRTIGQGFQTSRPDDTQFRRSWKVSRWHHV